MSKLDEKYLQIRNYRAHMLKVPLTSAESCAEVRQFFLNAVERTNNVGYLYRYLPDEFPLEDDLRSRLDAFVELDDRYTSGRSGADLRLLRREAFQRCAFGLAHEINRGLRKRRASWLWINKDFILPQVPLALAIGYGATLGLPYPWFRELANDAAQWAALVILFCAFSWFLIYRNIRDKIGDISDAWPRSMIVFGGALAWSAIYLAAARYLAHRIPSLDEAFHWLTALLMGAVALFIAILAQFFFSKSGSIADPL